jgi:hypothetical protein
MTTKSITQLLVFSFVFTLFIMPRSWGENDCHLQKLQFMHTCYMHIRRNTGYLKPISTCCKIVRTYDMACVCRSINDQDEKTIDGKHAYFVTRDCHNPVPAGNKCGSKCLISFNFLINCFGTFIILFTKQEM